MDITESGCDGNEALNYRIYFNDTLGSNIHGLEWTSYFSAGTLAVAVKVTVSSLPFPLHSLLRSSLKTWNLAGSISITYPNTCIRLGLERFTQSTTYSLPAILTHLVHFY